MRLPIIPLRIPAIKIRGKIFLGAGIYIFLATIIGVFAYRELYSINSKLPLVEKMDDMTHSIIEARTYEKNFLLYRQERDIGEFKRYISAIKAVM